MCNNNKVHVFIIYVVLPCNYIYCNYSQAVKEDCYSMFFLLDDLVSKLPSVTDEQKALQFIDEVILSQKNVWLLLFV